jgi:hypothetical protein
MVCPAAPFQTNSFADLAGANAASRTSLRLSRDGSDRHKKPGPVWRRRGEITIRATCCPDLLAPVQPFGKRRDKVLIPLTCQEEAQ